MGSFNDVIKEAIQAKDSMLRKIVSKILDDFRMTEEEFKESAFIIDVEKRVSSTIVSAKLYQRTICSYALIEEYTSSTDCNAKMTMRIEPIVIYEKERFM